MRECILSNYITEQYDVDKLEEVIKVFMDLIETAMLKLANDDYYIKITPSYEMRFAGNQLIFKTSKIDSFLVDRYDTDEKLQELLFKCSKSFNNMTKQEREFFTRKFIKQERKFNLINDMSLHQYQYDQLRKSSIVKFCLVLGLDKFVNVI